MRQLGTWTGALAAASLVAGTLMIASTFTTVAKVDVAHGSCEVINDSNPALADRCKLSGWERHGPGIMLLGLFAIAMGYGAAVGRSRPAAVALAAVGVATLALALASDVPKTHETGAIGQDFQGAKAGAGPGLYLEIAGGVLAVATAAAAFERSRRETTAER